MTAGDGGVDVAGQLGLGGDGLVEPTPIFSVGPTRTAMWSVRQAANSRVRSVLFLPSCTNRTKPTGHTAGRSGCGVRDRRSSLASGVLSSRCDCAWSVGI